MNGNKEMTTNNVFPNVFIKNHHSQGIIISSQGIIISFFCRELKDNYFLLNLRRNTIHIKIYADRHWLINTQMTESNMVGNISNATFKHLYIVFKNIKVGGGITNATLVSISLLQKA